MTSAARIEANRLNARKSTGPRTPEGKDRSRQNAMTHGLRAESLDLPGEKQAIAARAAEWAAVLRPANPIERWVAARAAVASVRLDRCTEMEADRIDERTRRARDRFFHRRDADARRLGVELDMDPTAIEELRATAAGCDWLLGAWAELAEALDAPSGWALGEPFRACQLLGHPADAIDPGPQILTIFEDAEKHQAGDPAAGARLRELVRGAVAELEARRDAIWDEVDAPALHAAIRRARFDSSPLGARMQRYEAAHAAELDRRFRQLKAGVAPNEPNDPAQLPIPDEVGTSAPDHIIPPRGPEAASIIHDPALQEPTSSSPSPAPAAAPNEPNTATQIKAPRILPSQEQAERLVSDPAVSAAWPVVLGTAITVEDIALLLRPPHDLSPAQVVAEFEGRITLDDVRAARNCWAWMTYTRPA